MAGIDKLYVESYEDLIDLIVWSDLYYPKLLYYIYKDMFTISKSEFNKRIDAIATHNQEVAVSTWKQISPNDTINCAVATMMYLYDMSEKEATEEAIYSRKRAKMSLTEFKRGVKLPVMNTPLEVDRKLKWICPLPFVRKYLQLQCGVKEHWYYKLFWKGKELYFYYF